MKWMFPNHPLSRLDYLKRVSAFIGISLITFLLIIAIPQDKSGFMYALYIIVLIAYLVIIIGSLNALWWRIRSCFKSTGATAAWFVFTLVFSLIGLIWLFWPPKIDQNLDENSTSNRAIIIITVLFAALLVLGVLASIALPAYQTYVEKAKEVGAAAKVSKDISETGTVVATKFEAYALKNLTWPKTENDLQSQSVTGDVSFYVRDQKVVITDNIETAQLVMTASFEKGKITWNCEPAGVYQGVLPSICTEK
jgi:Tfp pilus assembly protein PilE